MNIYIRTEEFPAVRHVIKLMDGPDEIGHVQLIVWPVRKKGQVTGERYATLQDNWVHTDHRHRGHGQRLLARTIDVAKREKVARIYLTARDRRRVARHIYEKFGFKQTTQGYVLELEYPNQEDAQ